MPDDKTKRGASDRRLAAGQLQYVVFDFERKHGLTTDEAREILGQAGPSRTRADALAQILKRVRSAKEQEG